MHKIAAWSRRDRRQRMHRWRAEAKQIWDTAKHDPFFTFGVALYWGEGNKTGGLILVNMDPKVIRVWISWCRKYFPACDFHGAVLVHPDVDVIKAKRFWARVMGKTPRVWVNRHGRKGAGSGTAHGKVRHGTARVTIARGSTECLVKMLQWIKFSGQAYDLVAKQ